MNAPRPDLIIQGASVSLNAYQSSRRNLALRAGTIREITEPPQETNPSEEYGLPILDLTGYLLLPGLINAHDHLEFGIFPRMGNGKYPSWQEWANDIYRPEESPLRELLAIPKPVRLFLGGLRNLLCGVTTVAHHNPYQPEIFEKKFPVRVLSRYGWAHSLDSEGIARQAFLQTPSDWPFFLHFAEGTDPKAYKEFSQMHSDFKLNNRLVLIHAVGVTQSNLSALEEAEVSLVWCPSSNMFTLGKTLSAKTVCSYRFLTLGSDSPLTSTGDLLDELRYAYSFTQVPTELLYQMVTTRAASALRLERGAGEIRSGSSADLIAVRDRGQSPADTLVSLSRTDIECVIQEGEIRLLSPELAARIPTALSSHLEEVQVNQISRFLPSPLASLIREASQYEIESCSLKG